MLPPSIHVNFQPTGRGVPAGYLPDTGAVFGSRGNGYSYGWDAANSANAVDRNSSLSPDQRYDTFEAMQAGGIRRWEIGVPNGDWAVHVAAGDAAAFNSTYKIAAEGTLVVNGTPTSGSRWVQGWAIVHVTDGRITVTNAAGAANNKIAFFEAVPVAAGTTRIPNTVTVTAADASAAEGGTDTGRFTISRAGDLSAPLTVTYTTSGTATAGSDYQSLAGSVTIPANVASATVTVNVVNDTAVESAETVTITATNGPHFVVNPTATVTIRDNDGLNWFKRPDSPIYRFEANGISVGGKMYVFGGFYNRQIQATKRSDVYDPAANRWDQLPDMPEAATHVGLAYDGRYIWAVGGFVGNDPGPVTAHVWKYDVANRQWTAGPGLPAARAAGGVGLIGRTLHFFGGIGGGNLQTGADKADHWVLNVDTSTKWTSAAPLPNPRNHLGAAVLNGVLYAIGGQHGHDEANGNQTTVNAFNPSTGQWTTVAPIITARGHIQSATFVANGKIYVAGGSGNGGVKLSSVVAYSPSAGWTTVGGLPSPRGATVAGPLGSLMFVATGDAGAAVPMIDAWVSALPG